MYIWVLSLWIRKLCRWHTQETLSILQSYCIFILISPTPYSFVSFVLHIWLLPVLKITVIKGGAEMFQSLCWIWIHTSSVKEGWPWTCSRCETRLLFWRISPIYQIYLFWVKRYVAHSKRNWEASHPVQGKFKVLVSKAKWFSGDICGDKLPTYLS